MGELIIFPDVEGLAVEAVREGLAELDDAVPVDTRVPNPRPKAFIRIIRTGGPQETLISEAAQLTVESFDELEHDAVMRFNRVRAILSAQDGVLFGVSWFAGPQNLPDPTTDQVRYTASCLARVRGSVLA